MPAHFSLRAKGQRRQNPRQGQSALHPHRKTRPLFGDQGVQDAPPTGARGGNTGGVKQNGGRHHPGWGGAPGKEDQRTERPIKMCCQGNNCRESRCILRAYSFIYIQHYPTSTPSGHTITYKIRNAITSPLSLHCCVVLITFRFQYPTASCMYCLMLSLIHIHIKHTMNMWDRCTTFCMPCITYLDIVLWYRTQQIYPKRSVPRVALQT